MHTTGESNDGVLVVSHVQGGEQSIHEVTEAFVAMLASRWETSASFHLNCGNCNRGSLVALTVSVGSASATQVAGLEP